MVARRSLRLSLSRLALLLLLCALATQGASRDAHATAIAAPLPGLTAAPGAKSSPHLGRAAYAARLLSDIPPQRFASGDQLFSHGSASGATVTDWYSKGTLVQTLAGGSSGGCGSGGMAFGTHDNLYIVGATIVHKYDPTGTQTATLGAGHLASPSDVITTPAGNIVVADCALGFVTFDATGMYLSTDDPRVVVDPNGDQTFEPYNLDLAPDGCVVCYDWNQNSIAAHNLCTGTTSGLNFGFGHAQALWVRPNGQVLVAEGTPRTDGPGVSLLNPDGSLAQGYLTNVCIDGFYGLSLDPDGKSFWVIDVCSGGTLLRVDFATGAVISSSPKFATGFEVVGEPSPGHGKGLVVNTTADSHDAKPGDGICADTNGLCSLRAAIEEANAEGGGSISFAIPGGGVQTITVKLGAMSVGEGITIDATTQPGYAGSPIVKLLGQSGDGLTLSSNDTVTGLDVEGFDTGILLKAANNTVTQDYIGTDETGAAAPHPNEAGVRVSGGSNTIGELNVISGNSDNGILLSGSAATGNTVNHNLIGTDPGGRRAVPNGLNGVAIVEGAKNNTVGNVASLFLANVISGNTQYGIVMRGAATGPNQILHNRLGTDASGNKAVGNSVGIFIDDARQIEVSGNLVSGNLREGVFIDGESATGDNLTGNMIGSQDGGFGQLPNSIGVHIDSGSGNYIGVEGKEPNVISGNSGDGVLINGGATGNFVRHNYIGTDVNVAAALPNAGNGVHIKDAYTNQIGGSKSGQGNTISGNGAAGVYVEGSKSSNNSILGNSIGVYPLNEFGSGNQGYGVQIIDASSHNVLGSPDGSAAGGSCTGGCNLISNNVGGGVELGVHGAGPGQGRSSPTDTTIQSNFIGVSASGDPVGNGGNYDIVATGKLGRNDLRDVIGGDAVADSNTIGGGVGVFVDVGQYDVRITRNSILGEVPKDAINLASKTPPHTIEGNGFESPPKLTKASAVSGGIEITGTMGESPLVSDPDTDYAIEFFAGSSCEYVTGTKFAYFGSATVHTNQKGVASFDLTPGQASGGQYITATATSPKYGTSYFSNCVPLS